MQETEAALAEALQVTYHPPTEKVPRKFLNLLKKKTESSAETASKASNSAAPVKTSVRVTTDTTASARTLAR